MPEKKVEHVSGGSPREFSAIKGQGKNSTGPKGGCETTEKPAIAKIWPKNGKEE